MAGPVEPFLFHSGRGCGQCRDRDNRAVAACPLTDGTVHADAVPGVPGLPVQEHSGHSGTPYRFAGETMS